MRQHLLAIIAVLAVAILTLFSINTDYSGSRYGYGYGRQNVVGTQFIASNNMRFIASAGADVTVAENIMMPDVEANDYSSLHRAS